MVVYRVATEHTRHRGAGSLIQMGYIFLVIALFSGVTKGYCGKKTSQHTSSFRLSVFANVIRTLLCTAIGFAVTLLEGSIYFITPSVNLLLITALSGISTAIFVVSWLISVRKSAYMLMDIFLMVGVLVPLVLSMLFFNETIRPSQWVGILILLIATIIMCSYNNNIKAKITLPTFLLLMACGIANGITDFSQKLFVKALPDIPVSIFNLYTYIFAAITLIITHLLLKPNDSMQPKRVVKSIFGYIFIMALCLFLNSYFKTIAAATLSSVILYPLNQGASLVLSSIMAAGIFKEKLTAKVVLGMITSFIGLLIINVL